MDDQGVRHAAEEHVRAIVEGRIKDALTYVVQELRAQTAANLLKVAHLATSATVDDVRIEGDEAVVRIRFGRTGDGAAKVEIESEWWEIDGRPQLVRAVEV